MRRLNQATRRRRTPLSSPGSPSQLLRPLRSAGTPLVTCLIYFFGIFLAGHIGGGYSPPAAGYRSRCASSAASIYTCSAAARALNRMAHPGPAADRAEASRQRLRQCRTSTLPGSIRGPRHLRRRWRRHHRGLPAASRNRRDRCRACLRRMINRQRQCTRSRPSPLGLVVSASPWSVGDDQAPTSRKRHTNLPLVGGMLIQQVGTRSTGKRATTAGAHHWR